MTSIKGSAQLVERILDRDRMDGERLRRLTGSIVRASDRLAALIVVALPGSA